MLSYDSCHCGNQAPKHKPNSIFVPLRLFDDRTKRRLSFLGPVLSLSGWARAPSSQTVSNINEPRNRAPRLSDHKLAARIAEGKVPNHLDSTGCPK